MSTASLELCKELYELSGWVAAERCWYTFAEGDAPGLTSLLPEQYKAWLCPAYDLGYLLRKLPKKLDEYGWLCIISGLEWGAGYDYLKPDGTMHFPCDANTPEDAACKLAIELWKQGILS